MVILVASILEVGELRFFFFSEYGAGKVAPHANQFARHANLSQFDVLLQNQV